MVSPAYPSLTLSSGLSMWQSVLLVMYMAYSPPHLSAYILRPTSPFRDVMTPLIIGVGEMFAKFMVGKFGQYTLTGSDHAEYLPEAERTRTARL